MEDEKPTERTGGPAFVTAATEHAVLKLPAERLELIAEAAAPVHQALQGLAAIDLGETMPATSFDPSWDECHGTV
jgi:hypothetical protein